MYYVVVIYRNL